MFAYDLVTHHTLYISVCRLPVDSGTCDSDYPRWYFDESTSQCEQFVYGGCEGNNNRFSTQQECERTCHELLITRKASKSSLSSNHMSMSCVLYVLMSKVCI